MLRARVTFHGPDFLIAAGVELPEDHPIVQGREALFEPAVKTPGKPRTPRRPRHRSEG